MSGKAHHGDGGSDRSDEGRLLGLILDTNREDAIRRRTARLRSTDKARRVFSSSPTERNPREMGDSPKQQAPRQPTAEVPAKITIVRSKTLPASESVSTTTPVAVRGKRPPTPTAPSHVGEGVTPSSPAAKRDMPSLNGNDRAGERGGRGRRDGTSKIPAIPRAASSERADAMEVAGAREARRFSSGVQRVSFEGLPHSNSPRKKGKKASSPARDPTKRAPLPASVATRGSGGAVLPTTVGGVSGEREMMGGSTPRGKPRLTSKTPDSAGSENR